MREVVTIDGSSEEMRLGEPPCLAGLALSSTGRLPIHFKGVCLAGSFSCHCGWLMAAQQSSGTAWVPV